MSCAVQVRIVYDRDFGEGCVYRFAIERVLEGVPPRFERPVEDVMGRPADGYIVVPPYGPGGVPDYWGLGCREEPMRAVLRFEAEPRPIEEVEPFRPCPGSGLGVFLPPGAPADGGYAVVTGVEVMAAAA